MCLGNLASKKELIKFKKTLPKEFDVFKVMNLDGLPEYWQKGEAKLQKKGVYKARCRIANRRICKDYKPGFHVFLTKQNAEHYKHIHSLATSKIKRFQAKRSWITAKGGTSGYNFSRCVPCIVLSKIKVV